MQLGRRRRHYYLIRYLKRFFLEPTTRHMLTYLTNFLHSHGSNGRAHVHLHIPIGIWGNTDHGDGGVGLGEDDDSDDLPELVD